jgi:hypothetical protein
MGHNCLGLPDVQRDPKVTSLVARSSCGRCAQHLRRIRGYDAHPAWIWRIMSCKWYAQIRVRFGPLNARTCPPPPTIQGAQSTPPHNFNWLWNFFNWIEKSLKFMTMQCMGVFLRKFVGKKNLLPRAVFLKLWGNRDVTNAILVRAIPSSDGNSRTPPEIHEGPPNLAESNIKFWTLI